MSKVFEIKPGYAVRLANGNIMFAVVTSNMDGVENTGFGLMDVKVRADAKPATSLFGHDETGDTQFWTIDDYNDKLEYKSEIGGRVKDRDIIAIYGYSTPRAVFATSDKALSIRPVLWERDTAKTGKPVLDGEKKPTTTYEDAKQAISEWRDEIDSSDASDDEKKAQHGFVSFLEMLIDLAHICEENMCGDDDDAADDVFYF